MRSMIIQASGSRLGGGDDAERRCSSMRLRIAVEARRRIVRRPRVDVEFDDVAFGVALEALVEDEVHRLPTSRLRARR